MSSQENITNVDKQTYSDAVRDYIKTCDCKNDCDKMYKNYCKET